MTLENVFALIGMSCALWGLAFAAALGAERFIFGRIPHYKSVSIMGLSVFHAAVVVGASPVWMQGPYVFGLPNTFAQNLILAFSLGFFIVDTVLMALFRYTARSEWFHHFLCVGGVGLVLIAQRSGWESITFLSLAEMSFCFFIKWALKDLSIDKSHPVYRLNEAALLSVFLLVRVVLVPAFVMLGVSSPDVSWMMKVPGIAMMALGLHWSYRFTQILISKSRNPVLVTAEEN